MGWASGSGLAEDIWDIVRPLTKPSNKKRIAGKLIELFEDMDCDTIDEAERLCADAGRKNDDCDDDTEVN